MSGTKEGSVKGVATIKAKYGEDFYRELGKRKKNFTKPSGFALDRERASLAGKKGGATSRKLTGVETMGFYQYFEANADKLNGITADDFVAMYKLNTTYTDLAKAIGRSLGLVCSMIRAIKKEGLA